MSTSSKENAPEIFEDIKKNLTRGVKDRKHTFHTPVFSNIDSEGGIDSRVVVLRKFDPNSMTLNFHTDFRSPKVPNLKKNSSSQFVFYDHKLKIQMRIKTTSLVNNQNDTAKEMWDKTRLFSRKCYLTLKDPSSITEIPEDGIPEQDYLEYRTGDTEETKYESHAPIVIYKDKLNYKEIKDYKPVDKGSQYKTGDIDTKLTGKDDEETRSLSLCCDRIHIVYGDFDANTAQAYKKYRISYFALPMQKMSGTIITDRYYAIYRSKESWQQPTADDPGKWISESNDFCPDCYQAELMREYLVDMEFIALDKYGEKINTDPAEDHSKLYDIRSVDIKLTFRSSSPKGYFKRKIKNVIKSFDDDRMTSIEDSFHRESIFVTVHTRNIGEVL